MSSVTSTFFISFHFQMKNRENSIFLGKYERKRIGTVPDSKSRNIPEVVIVRRWAVGVLGIWRGGTVGWRVGQIGSVYKQAVTEVDDSCHSWRVPSKWKGTQRGGKRESARGARGARGSAPCIYDWTVCAKEWLNVWMLSIIVYIIITRMNVVDNLNSV